MGRKDANQAYPTMIDVVDVVDLAYCMYCREVQGHERYQWRSQG